MRVLPALGLAAVLVGTAAYLLWPSGSKPHVEPERPPESVDEGARVVDRPALSTGKLVVRVRLSNGDDVPPTTRAGYSYLGEKHLRSPTPDFTFPFADAPAGPVQAIAEAPGYTADPVPVRVVPGVDGAEAVVTLTPIGK